MPLPPPPSDLPQRVDRLAMVARWRPVHLGHAAVLRSLLERAEHVIVGIGSPNRYDLRNPWTGPEVRHMLELVEPQAVASGHLELVEVPDLGDGPRWAAMVVELWDPVDLFVTANPWVWSLLEHTWTLCHPVHLVPEHRRVPLTGTMVRRAMARGEDWQAMVPPAVARWLQHQGLVDRFRREFGLQVLARDLPD